LKSRVVFFILFFLSLNAQLFARGKQEETEVTTQNDEWLLCVTDFDISSLPPEKLNVAGVITKQIVERLNAVSYRTRVSPEYAYYEEYAWSNARSSAAKALSAKQDERSLLIYRGEENWKYKQNLARVNADIEKLRLDFEAVDESAPLINNEPVVKLTAGNIDSSFPQAPAEGGESKFCRDQKADAFLTGTVTDFHGRYYITINLYTLYTRSFVYKDSVIFSHDDLDSSLDEITSRLLLTISGNNPAKITVTTEPEETLVLINKSFAGKGEITQMEYPPGKYTVTASALDHEGLSVDTELFPGEQVEINFQLKPIEYGNVEILGASSGGNVYHGALYAGEAPYTLRLPLNIKEYVELVNKDGEDERIGKIVFDTPDNPDPAYRLSLRTKKPQPEGRVDNARRMFYWSWGLTWAAAITAWVTYQSFVSSNNALEYQYKRTETFDQKFYDDTYRMYNIYQKALIGVFAAAALDAFFVGRYLYVSNRDAASVSKIGRKK